MRLCILGGFGGDPDEGMKNIAINIRDRLGPDFEVLATNPKDFGSFAFWRKLSQFDPEVVHYVPGPSLKSFLLMKLIGIRYPRARLIMSASHPKISKVSMKMARYLKPHCILVESKLLEERFRPLGCNVLKVPFSGVDMTIFAPASMDRKAALRKKYGVPENKFVVLHVGHNCSYMGALQGGPVHCVSVRPFSEDEAGPSNELESMGCTVITGFVPHIEEIYQLADCYLFFSTDGVDCIHMPLSILEAMACNLPIVTTRFGALPDYFPEGAGLVYMDGTPASIIQAVKDVMPLRSNDNQEKVRAFSWNNIIQNLSDIYRITEAKVPSEKYKTYAQGISEEES